MDLLKAWFLSLHPQVRWQTIGRGVYQAGHGLFHFYTPLIFVNQLGFSATTIGLGVGSASIASVIGHILAGSLVDLQPVGRRGTLLMAAGLAVAASLSLGATPHLWLLVVANLLFGLSMGLYWTAADAAVMDVTTAENRASAFAVLGVADSVGRGVGVLSGGWILAALLHPQTLFLLNSLIFLGFLGLTLVTIAETRQPHEPTSSLVGWQTALSDKALWLFVLISCLFTTYMALVNTTLPLYFTTVLSSSTAAMPSSPQTVGTLFTWGYIALAALLQVPLVRLLSPLGWARALMVDLAIWGFGFLAIWTLGTVLPVHFTLELGVLALLAIATVIYKPFASTFLAELAPETMRGTYTAIGHQCWAIGYFLGPTLGGWAIDQAPVVAHLSWIGLAMSTGVGIALLVWFTQWRAAEQWQYDAERHSL
ncbi:MAG: MFS transporter [Elainellaceae cyanobacterium]